ncbi:MAG: hypothetical protein ACTH5D_14700 [Halomonas sp.]|uniref:hypothetical protein n=1 Tax=Halomonas sp. TaxID=1486246 RepID=UPI003F9363D1
MSALVFTPMSVEDTMALARGLHLDLPEERAVVIANVVAHIRNVVGKLDEMPCDETCAPAFQYSVGGE